MINVSELKKEVDHLNYKLNGITKYVCILNSRDENIDVILGMGKPLNEMKGIGYISESPNSKIGFVFPIRKAEIKMSRKMMQLPTTHYYQHNNVTIRPYRICLVWSMW